MYVEYKKVMKPKDLLRKVLSNQELMFKALHLTSAIFALNSPEDSKVTPRSFTVDIFLILVPSGVVYTSSPMGIVPNMIHSVLSGFTTIL